MEASATTVNSLEAPTLGKPEEPVLDTPRYKSGAKKGKLKPTAKKAMQKQAMAGGFNVEDLKEAMKVLGGELRKPDAATEQERALQKARDLENRKHEQQAIMEAKAQTDAVQAQCAAMGHKMDNGRSEKSAVFGQVHGHGKHRVFRAMCVVCQYEFPPREPGPEE